MRSERALCCPFVCLFVCLFLFFFAWGSCSQIPFFLFERSGCEKAGEGIFFFFFFFKTHSRRNVSNSGSGGGGGGSASVEMSGLRAVDRPAAPQRPGPERVWWVFDTPVIVPLLSPLCWPRFTLRVRPVMRTLCWDLKHVPSSGSGFTATVKGPSVIDSMPGTRALSPRVNLIDVRTLLSLSPPAPSPLTCKWSLVFRLSSHCHCGASARGKTWLPLADNGGLLTSQLDSYCTPPPHHHLQPNPLHSWGELKDKTCIKSQFKQLVKSAGSVWWSERRL